MDETESGVEAGRLAPGVPADYYDRIRAFEDSHWWYLGMRSVLDRLIGDRLSGPGVRLLDAGCGTGGFLAWASSRYNVNAPAGADVSSAAIDLAKTRVPNADLRVAPLSALPWDDDSFNLVVTQDVLQHIAEDELDVSLRELRRVLQSGGVLFVRTNGARRLRRVRDDWRAFDTATVTHLLEKASFRVRRVTHANMLLSLWGSVRGAAPTEPTETKAGVPTANAGALRSRVGRQLLEAEARYLGSGRDLPYGHTIVAVAEAP
jgi:ubiquinone/menaquinone biosynthesis C-methylase UbiE